MGATTHNEQKRQAHADQADDERRTDQRSKSHTSGDQQQDQKHQQRHSSSRPTNNDQNDDDTSQQKEKAVLKHGRSTFASDISEAITTKHNQIFILSTKTGEIDGANSGLGL